MHHFQILSSFAEFEKNCAGERTKTALQSLKSQGKVYCRKLPYGKILSDDKKKFENNSEEQKVISRMKNLRSEGFSLQKIADILNDEKIPTREGGIWKKQTISYILKRRKESCRKH